jgi:hypothetical protein
VRSISELSLVRKNLTVNFANCKYPSPSLPTFLGFYYIPGVSLQLNIQTNYSRLLKLF